MATILEQNLPGGNDAIWRLIETQFVREGFSLGNSLH
jgi:hypothetical protein